MSDLQEALQARVDELQSLLVLMRRHPAMMAEALGITPTHARILTRLREASPDAVLCQDLHAELFGDREVSGKLIHVHMSKMRKRLAECGITVHSVIGNKRPGWDLPPDMVAKLDDLLERHFAGVFGSAA